MKHRIFTVLLSLFSLANLASAQSYEPAITTQSLLKMMPRLNAEQPYLSHNELDLAFAPQGDFTAQVIFRNGEQVIQQFEAKPNQRVGSMARMRWRRKTVQMGAESGPRSVEVLLDGKSVGLIEFTLTKEAGSDPFDPKPTWVLDGPWGSHAYFTYPTKGSGQKRINFHFWSRVGEIGTEKGMIDVEIKRGSKVLAKTKPSEASYVHYLHRDKGLRKPDGKVLMVADLQSMAGPFVAELTHKGKLVKRFRGTIADGKFVPHAQSALDYQPRNQFLSPRTINDGGGQVSNELYSWVTRE